jgi:hypothetical protein
MAELRPRPVAPEEVDGKPEVVANGAGGRKRKVIAADPDDGMGLGKKVARKLF